MAEHNLPWAYRPNEFDDWGFIRDATDCLAACARGDKGVRSHDGHRAAGTDPYGEYAAFIVLAVNNHDALVKELKLARARIEYLGAACNDPRHFSNNAEVLLPRIDAVLALVAGVKQP